MITQWAVGCLLNESQMRSPMSCSRPNYGLVFLVDCGWTDKQIRDFNLKTLSTRISDLSELVITFSECFLFL